MKWKSGRQDRNRLKTRRDGRGMGESRVKEGKKGEGEGKVLYRYRQGWDGHRMVGKRVMGKRNGTEKDGPGSKMSKQVMKDKEREGKRN